MKRRRILAAWWEGPSKTPSLKAGLTGYGELRAVTAELFLYIYGILNTEKYTKTILTNHLTLSPALFHVLKSQKERLAVAWGQTLTTGYLRGTSKPLTDVCTRCDESRAKIAIFAGGRVCQKKPQKALWSSHTSSQGPCVRLSLLREFVYSTLWFRVPFLYFYPCHHCYSDVLTRERLLNGLLA